jgi:opacity protein-like surface antigen
MPHNRSVRRLALAAAIVIVLLASASAASAQTLGLRVGASVDPDQFYFGAHYETRPLVDRLRFRPNIEAGIGDEVTTTALNFELAYHFPDASGGWHFYGGAGPALIFYKRNGDTDAQGGFNVLLGVEHRGGLFVEIKAGAIDSPNFKIGVGYTFK